MNNRIYIIIIFFVNILMNSCKTSENFRFKVPDISPWEDTDIKYINSNDGVKLAYRDLGDIKEKRALIFIPGSTMYGYYYVPFMRVLSKHDVFVRVLDIRGHGDSDGKRGDVPHEDSIVDDLSLHIEQIRLRNPDIDVFIGGHSMGAGICGRYLEKYGFDEVKGVVYVSPLFHYKQPGMKNPGYVNVNILKTIFGGDHEVTQVYHPGSNDPKLVRNYTKMMSKASMVSDFQKFRQNHTTSAVIIIGKEDELFDWKKTLDIFRDQKAIRYIVIDEASHLDVILKSTKKLIGWLNRF